MPGVPFSSYLSAAIGETLLVNDDDFRYLLNKSIEYWNVTEQYKNLTETY